MPLQKNISYMDKLTMVLGRKPYMPGVDYTIKINNLKTREEAAQLLFKVIISSPKDKAKAKKLGLI